MRRGTRRVWPILAGFFVLATGFPLGSPPAALAVSPNVVISQVYGGGGNSGATYTHDFIELFNRGTSSASIAGWSVQYASATGTGNFGANSGQQTDLPAVSIAPGQYLLIQEASNAAVGTPLPTPDVTDATPIAMAAGAGKVALVNTTASLGCNGGSTPCSPAALAQIVDLVGYGTANFFEGSAAAPTLSASLAALREARGCMDTDDNQDDFAAGGPAPRNSSSAANPCGGRSLTINDVSASEGNSGTTSFDFTVSLSAAAGAGGVTFDITTADNTATTTDNDYVAKSLTGQTIPAGNSTYAFSVLVNGDTAEEVNETFFVNVTNVTGATVSDGQGQGTIQNDDTDFCAQPYTHTYQIQGSGNSTGMNNAAVTTQGIVVGDYETSASLQGFYLQDEAGDDEATTSDGIFVFAGSGNLVSAGDRVRVSGFAGERFGETAIDGSATGTTPVTAANIVDCGTGSVGATDVEMPFANSTFPERFEGMLVRLPQDLVIAEYFNYERFGEIVLAEPIPGETRPFTPTAVVEPGAPAQARLLANQLSRITLDDAIAAQNPDVLRHPNGDPFSLGNRFRGGDRVTNTVGVLGFGFSLYRIFPTAPAQYDATNPRPAAPEDVGGRLKVAAMNTLNFFLTLDTTASDTGPGPCGGNQNLDCRGADADQPMEFSRQRDKLIAALAGLNADVIGLNELENTPDVDPLGDPTRGVVAGLNATPGAGTYARIDTGVIGTDAIRVGLIYRPAVVQPVGDFELLTSADDPRFIDTLSRPALAQTFVELATGARFTVVVNHLKSKNASPACDADNGDGQGNCNLVRKAAAEALVDWLATDPTGSDDPDFVIVGDLNSYAMEDPIDAVRAGEDDTHGTGDDFTNLIARYQGTHAYSFVFDGMSGYLDHALSSRSLTLQVTGATEWHINSDEPDLLDYDTSFKPPAQEAIYEPNAYRSSDHDPVIIGLDLVPTQGKVTGDGTFADGSFALSAQYENGTTAATGSTSLSLTGVGSFTSTAYDWLVLSGNRATYQGVGTLDGDAGYGFLVSVLDGGAPGAGQDKIRIRIWESDGDVVYDSQPADDFTAAPTSFLTSGNLTVHKPK